MQNIIRNVLWQIVFAVFVGLSCSTQRTTASEAVQQSQVQKIEPKIIMCGDDVFYAETDSMVALSVCAIGSLARWRSNHESWIVEADSVLHTKQIFESAVSFTQRDSNCAYILTRYVSPSLKRSFGYRLNRQSKVLKDYLAWSGADSTSIWLSLDTIPSSPSLVYSEVCPSYYEIKRVGVRKYSGWIKDEKNRCLPNAYLYGVVDDYHWGKIAKSDSLGHFECSVPDVPMTIMIQDGNYKELMRFDLKEGDQIDKKIRIRQKNKKLKR